MLVTCFNSQEIQLLLTDCAQCHITIVPVEYAGAECRVTYSYIQCTGTQAVMQSKEIWPAANSSVPLCCKHWCHGHMLMWSLQAGTARVRARSPCNLGYESWSQRLGYHRWKLCDPRFISFDALPACDMPPVAELCSSISEHDKN